MIGKEDNKYLLKVAFSALSFLLAPLPMLLLQRPWTAPLFALHTDYVSVKQTKCVRNQRIHSQLMIFVYASQFSNNLCTKSKIFDQSVQQETYCAHCTGLSDAPRFLSIQIL